MSKCQSFSVIRLSFFLSISILKINLISKHLMILLYSLTNTIISSGRLSMRHAVRLWQLELRDSTRKVLNERHELRIGSVSSTHTSWQCVNLRSTCGWYKSRWPTLSVNQSTYSQTKQRSEIYEIVEWRCDVKVKGETMWIPTR
jgi:hypothetical protein